MSDENTQPASSTIFISYSRKNKEFVKKLNDSLDNSGIEAWVDWEGIPPSSDWMEEISRAIESADAFLFVISPDSIASKICAEELEIGTKHNKKLVPILHIEPERGTQMHERLSSHNWVYMREQDDYDAGIARVLESISIDLDWVRQHTRLLQRAVEWDGKNRNSSFLLQGADLEDAERWRSDAASDENRKVTALQSDYIDASRQAATKRQRMLLIGVSMALVVSIGLAIYAVFQSNLATQNAELASQNAATAVANGHLAATAEADAEANAEQAKANELQAKANENEAKAQRSAAEAQIYQGRTGELFTSTLLAIDSWQREQTFQAEDILRQNLSRMPIPVVQAKQSGRINNVVFTSDGTKFVAASDAGDVCLWSVEDGMKEFCVQHGASVPNAFFIEQDQTIITGSNDGTVRLINMSDGSEKQRFEFGAPVLALDVSPDGVWLAVGREDNAVSFINLQNTTTQYTITTQSAVTTVRFSPNSLWVALGTKAGRVLIWQAGRTSGSFISGSRHNGEIYNVVFSPDSRWIVSVSEDSTARVGPVTGGQRYVLQHDDWLEDAAFGPSNDWFVTVADDYTIRVWETKTGMEKVRMKQDWFVQEVKISPDGEWIASAGWDKTVRIWNANTGSELIQIPLSSYGSALAFSDDGNRLLIGERDGSINAWDVSTLSTRVGYLVFPELMHEAHFSPSGEWLVTNSDDYKVWLVNKDQWFTTHTGTDGQAIIKADYLTYDMQFSPDSNWLVVAESEYSSNAILYNMQKRTSILLPHGTGSKVSSFSPDSKTLAVGGTNKLVTVWDVATVEKLYELMQAGEAFSVAYHPNGKLLLVGLDGHIDVWDLETKTVVDTLPQPGKINVIAFSDDGKYVATSSSQGLTYFWEVQGNSFSQVGKPFKQNGQALALDFSPDDKLLAIGGKEGYAYLIDLSVYQEIARIPHVIEVSGVSFSSDGAYLVTVSFKTAQIWDVSKIKPIYTQEIVDVACSRMTSNMSSVKWEELFFGEDYRFICPDLPVGSAVSNEEE